MKEKVLLLAFLASCVFAAGWAWHLIGIHYDVVEQLDTGGCGPEGGCFEVLQSSDAEILGVPVSVPAVPMFGLLAVLAMLAWAGRLERSRLSGLATLCGLTGLVFGGWLLFLMLFYIGSFCRFCALMDVANLLVLGLGVALHPDGPKAAFTGLPGVFRRMKGPGPELALVPVILAGTLAVHAGTVREVQEPPPIVQTTPTPATTTPARTPRPTTTPTTAHGSSFTRWLHTACRL